MLHSLVQNLQGRLGGWELKQDFCYSSESEFLLLGNPSSSVFALKGFDRLDEAACLTYSRLIVNVNHCKEFPPQRHPDQCSTEHRGAAAEPRWCVEWTITLLWLRTSCEMFSGCSIFRILRATCQDFIIFLFFVFTIFTNIIRWCLMWAWFPTVAPATILWY